MLIGPTASEREREAYRQRILDAPEKFIAQPTLSLSTCPTFVESGVAPRHIDLRRFVLSGKDVVMVPGGLTRVALKEGSLAVNSSQGVGRKIHGSLDETNDPGERQEARGKRVQRLGQYYDTSRLLPLASCLPLASRLHRRCSPAPPITCTGWPAKSSGPRTRHASWTLRTGCRSCRRTPNSSSRSGSHHSTSLAHCFPSAGAIAPSGRRTCCITWCSMRTIRRASFPVRGQLVRTHAPCAAASPPRCGRCSTPPGSSCSG